ncbi:MAG: hypothetical protein LBG74_08305 [Spirochaetaceae bacterium]|jgi:hypothetical protein|nr:hypothetical protein [Spirochaetaceae bacterium]
MGNDKQFAPHIERAWPYLKCAAAFLVSVFCAFIVFRFIPAQDGYITIAFKDTVDGKSVLAGLHKSGIKTVIAESNQTVFLNEFSSLVQLSPSEFLALVLDSDPRNDGYAKRVYDFFISGGENRFYIPVSELGIVSGSSAVEQRIRQAAGYADIAALYFPVLPAKPADTKAILPFLIAWIFITIFSIWKMHPNHIHSKSIHIKNGMRLFPLLIFLPCCRLGAAGCVAAAGIIASRTYISKININMIIRIVERRAPLYQFSELLWDILSVICFVFSAALAAAFWARSFAYGLSFAAVLFALFVVADGLTRFLCLARFDKKIKLGFSPVPLRASSARLPPPVPIFLLAGFLSAALDFIPAAARQEQRHAAASLAGLSGEDFRRHYLFQKNFSFTRLSTPMNSESAGYPHYTIDADGLVSADTGSLENSIPAEDAGGIRNIPQTPFAALAGLENTGQSPDMAGGLGIRSLCAALFGLLLILPFAFRYSCRRMPFFFLKRLAHCCLYGCM